MTEAELDSASIMERNKEEAVRAKEIAEKKMQNKDYVGARKIALKAQRLYLELENISQMLTVCQVHCSAEHKILHSEMDWYGILQITQTADEGYIKKQYRKLAFLLDPDKNKFTGAEAAFKLIGEAQRVLTDQQKRNLYDIKCKHCVRSAAPEQANQNLPSFPDGQQTFWTRRPFWEAYRNSFVRKQPGNQNNFTNTTSQQFTVSNMNKQQQNQNPPSFPDGQLTFWTRCPFCAIKYKHYRNILNRALRCQSCTKTFIAYDLDFQGLVAGANCSQSASAQQKEVLCQGAKVGSQATVGNPAGVGTRRTFGTGTREQQLFPKAGTTSDVGREFKITEKKDGNVEMGVGEEGKGRPMNQDKPEELKPSGNIGKKRQRILDEESSESFDSRSSTDMEEGGDNEESSESFDNGSSTDMEEYGDNEESSESFDNGSCTDIKEDGDNDDAFSSTPKISRLIGSFHATEEQNKDAVSEGGLPRIHSASKSNGASDVEKENPLEENLSNGKNENEMCKENGKEADGYKMVFKAGMERGLTVTLEIPQTELLKFSHQVPALRLTVEEKGSLRGSWELDPASLMRRGSFGGLSESGVSTRHDDEGRHRMVDDSITKNPSSASPLSSEHDEIPETEFHDFLTDKTSDKLRTGQIWAFYCDNDGMPKVYGKIKKIKPAPDFKVWVTWLEGFDLPEGIIVWTQEKGMPYCLGICESGNDTDELDSTSSFSHLLKAPLIGKNKYAIHPSKGEVWALYKNWDAEWTLANLLDCKYYVVEILGCNSLVTKVQVLVLVDGYKTVFKAAKERQLTVTLEIPHTELLRFSHQVPAFQLTAEKKGSLRGCWELDPASLMRRGSFGGLSESGVSTRHDDEGRHRMVDDSITKNPSSASPLSSEHDEIPETEFHDFLTDKTSDKLRTGQIWAFYCDNDGMPKVYGKIKKIKPAPDFKVWVTWLEGFDLPEGIIVWTQEKGMPYCLGICESGNDTDELDSTSSFSHLLKASLIGKNKYAIHPSKGEVWALYKNWDAEWTLANLLDCKYDVVEILGCNSLVTKVQVLVLVDGYKTVFKAAKERQLTVTLEIPHTELLRFSHQVPAFQLTAEKKGSLRGCWELDPAALPLPKISLN